MVISRPTKGLRRTASLPLRQGELAPQNNSGREGLGLDRRSFDRELSLARRIDEAWDADIRQRVEELESVEVQGLPCEEVKERLFHGFE